MLGRASVQLAPVKIQVVGVEVRRCPAPHPPKPLAAHPCVRFGVHRGRPSHPGRAAPGLERHTVPQRAEPSVPGRRTALVHRRRDGIRDIRRALGNEAAHLLRTLPRRGYMLALAAPQPVPEGTAVSDPLPAPPTGRPMVLLLPFENIGGDPEQGYFVEGLRADLVTDLTHFQELQIAAPATADRLPDGVAGRACLDRKSVV